MELLSHGLSMQKSLCLVSLWSNLDVGVCTWCLSWHLGPRDVEALARDLAVVKNRQESQAVKLKGEALFYQEKYDEAVAKYEEALEVDKENECAIANIGVVHL